MKELYEFGHFTLDVEESRLLRDGRPVALKPKVLETLLVLIENSGRAMDKEEMMKRLWPDSFVEEANLAVNISQLRKALGDDGDVYIETVPKRGYRFVAPVTKVLADRVDMVVRERTRAHIVIEEREGRDDQVLRALEPIGVPTSVFARELPKARTTRSTVTWLKQHTALTAVIGATVVTAIVVAGYFVSAKRKARIETPLKPNSLAILPFRNLRPNTETDFLGPSMADALINRLSNIRTLVVRPSSYVQKYGKQEVDPQVVARELNVSTLVMGSFMKDGDNLRVSAQLIDVSRGEVLWNETIDIKYEKLLTMEDRVAEQIIKGLHLRLSPDESTRVKADTTQNPHAYEAFILGRHLISSSEHQRATRLLEESVSLDPNYALAWTYLGKAYAVTASQYFGGREFYDKAQAAYDRALTLRPQQTEASVMLANFLTENNRVEEALPMLRRVVEENPNHPLARWELSYAYRYSGMLDQSIAEGESALQLEPNIKGHLFSSYLYAGQPEKFVNSLPMRDEAYILFYRGLGHYYLKDWSRARVYFDRGHQLDPSALVSQLGQVLKLAMDGRNREGLDLLKVTENKLQKDPFGDGELSYKLAECYSVLGDKPSALRLLKKSVGQGFFCYPYFLSDPLLEHVRREPEYASLIDVARQRHQRFKQTFF